VPHFDVTVAGELNLDLILYGLPETLPLDREVVATEMLLTLGSSSAIVAHNLASLGYKVGFSSCVGTDRLGEVAVETLSAAGVDVSTVRQLGTNTKTGLTVILPHQTGRNIVTFLGAIAALKPEHLDLEYLASSRHFHLSSYYLQRGLQSYVPELFRRLKSAGLTISLDTNDDPDDAWESGLHHALAFVDIFLPNQREAMKISRCDSLELALTHLAKSVPIVVVKLGAEGSIASSGGEILRCAQTKVDVVADTVGAGDSFDAGFLSEFVKGASLEVCMRMGNLAGALSTTRSGGVEAFRDIAYREYFLRENAVTKEDPYA
jgi:sugar/nucleoside kinase (ribokinase family)